MLVLTVSESANYSNGLRHQIVFMDTSLCLLPITIVIINPLITPMSQPLLATVIAMVIANKLQLTS